jgi:hypothetical protein
MAAINHLSGDNQVSAACFIPNIPSGKKKFSVYVSTRKIPPNTLYLGRKEISWPFLLTKNYFYKTTASRCRFINY